MTTQHDIALLRLAAQRIAGTGFATATDAVGWLTAVQTQDYPGAVTSIALRTEFETRQDVEAALVVRSWPMRGTQHFVRAEDLPWMLDLTTIGYSPERRHDAHLAQTGTLCYGPVQVDEWVAHPRRPERERALGEWALRYFKATDRPRSKISRGG